MKVTTRIGLALERLFGIPPQRPKEEWEHVKVAANGTRYVDVDEFMQHPKVVEQVEAIKKLDFRKSS